MLAPRCTSPEELTHLIDFHTRILADNTCTTAWGIQQDTVKSSHDLGEFSSVVRANNNIFASQAMHIRCQTLGPELVHVVCKDNTGVLHEGSHVRRLTTGCGSHVEDALIWLRRKGDNGEEGGSCLQHVMTSKIFRGGPNGNSTLEDL